MAATKTPYNKVVKISKPNKALKKLKYSKLKKLELALVILATIIVAMLSLIIYILYNARILNLDALFSVSQQLNIQEAVQDVEIKSDYGFETIYNNRPLSASGYKENKDLVGKNEDLQFKNNYSLLTITPRDKSSGDNSSLTISTSTKKDFLENAKKQFGSNLNDTELAKKYFSKAKDPNYKYEIISNEKIKINDIEYDKSEYRQTPGVLGNKLTASAKVVDYVTVQNNRPYLIEIRLLPENSLFQGYYQDIVNHTKYFIPTTPLSFKTNILSNAEKSNIERPAFDFSPFIPKAHAAKKLSEAADDIKVIATNLPATVRVATRYCSTFELKTNYRVTIAPPCEAWSGSGFFITADGHIGTNGHVVKSDPVILLSKAIAVGDRDTITKLVQSVMGPNATKEEIAYGVNQVALDPEFYSVAILLDQKNVTIENAKDNYQYVVQLGKDPIEYDKNTGKFKTSGNIIEAKFIAADFDFRDFFAFNEKTQKQEFRASDVAILKAEGKNFPLTKLGDSNNLPTGSPVTIIGFPGAAENELIGSSVSKPTATKGVVSAVRETSGNKKKLIQTDASIDFGNSGGPAFNNDGEVIGLATYGIVSEGGGKFNYLRDIQDLKDLINKYNIDISGKSTTQSDWEKGLGNFINSHYKASIKDFEKVLKEYSPQTLAQEYIVIAKDKIAKGEEAPDFIIPIIVVSVFVVSAAGFVIIFIIQRKHRKALLLRRPGQMPYQTQNIPVQENYTGQTVAQLASTPATDVQTTAIQPPSVVGAQQNPSASPNYAPGQSFTAQQQNTMNQPLPPQDNINSSAKPSVDNISANNQPQMPQQQNTTSDNNLNQQQTSPQNNNQPQPLPQQNNMENNLPSQQLPDNTVDQNQVPPANQ
ncbi:MAG: trypsin-like peptidase domain-containing protein [bacterium]|nr:trypsin-like peptidase domain-containing protein [bacterium]